MVCDWVWVPKVVMVTIDGWERDGRQRETNLGVLIKMSNDEEKVLGLWLIVSTN